MADRGSRSGPARPKKQGRPDSRTQSAVPTVAQGAPPWLRHAGGTVVLALHVQPGARRTAVLGEHGERLKIALQALPVDGRANDALLHFLSERLGLRRSALRLTSGIASRDKSVAVDCDPAGAPALARRLSEN
jgi:uncharacterized protein